MFNDYNPLEPSTYRIGSEQDFITTDTQRNAFYDFDLFRGTGYGLEGLGIVSMIEIMLLPLIY